MRFLVTPSIKELDGLVAAPSALVQLTGRCGVGSLRAYADGPTAPRPLKSRGASQDWAVAQSRDRRLNGTPPNFAGVKPLPDHLALTAQDCRQYPRLVCRPPND